MLTSGVRIVDVAACSNVLILAPQGSFDFCDMKHKQQHCDGDTFVMLSSRKDLAVCCRDYFPFALSKIPTKEYILYIHLIYTRECKSPRRQLEMKSVIYSPNFCMAQYAEGLAKVVFGTPLVSHNAAPHVKWSGRREKR